MIKRRREGIGMLVFFSYNYFAIGRLK